MAKELHENKDTEERLILVGIELEDKDSPSAMAVEACLDELEELVNTAGATAVARTIQHREKVHPAHYLGKGKIEELKMMINTYDATGIVCDDELSPAQLKNLEKMLETKVMDRTIVILDIFAGRAISGEGKIQVELAQLKYRMSRLTGMGASMSRLGGGIGTRGPGEKKLETDRRHIKERIAELNRGLKEIQTHRELLRSQRSKKGTPVVSLVGYTNAGKSTTLNVLTQAGVLAEDKLFATLDTTTRKVELPGGSEILLTDTVGFIQKLPHHLIQAFRATLEELKYADILLHVVDASNPQRDKQMHIVYDTLYQLDIREKTVITLFNKQDQVTDEEPIRDFKADYTLAVSAKKGTGLEELKELFCTLLRDNKILVERTISYQEAGILQQIRKSGELLEEEYRPEGIFIRAYVTPEIYGSL